MKHLNLSFAACGFLGIYHLGAAAALYRHGKKLLKVVKAFAGASAGSLAATVLLAVPENIEIGHNSLSFLPVPPCISMMSIFCLVTGTCLVCLHAATKQSRILQLAICSLYSSCTVLVFWLLTSSFVPVYAGIKPVEYKGEKWVDGGLTNGLPILPVGRTVTVSPFSGRLDICPQDKGHVDLYVKLAKQDIMVS
ncbi:PLPL4 protein, partial [Nothocercus nigrocapillus]|nr:PLPL4 protein [Nothocercus nigrocapillus]